MRQKIIPSLMAKNQYELNALFRKLQGVARWLHLDVADGTFVPTRVNYFPLRLCTMFRYQAHLMVSSPARWVKTHGHKVDVIIFHPEITGDVRAIINTIKNLGKNVGLALKPETPVKMIEKFLPDIDDVLILTVHPGYYGGRFLRSSLKKIRQVKQNNSRVNVIVDGGMNPKTITETKMAGADYFVSGSYVTQAEHPKKAMKELRAAIK
jgi:ribulose-phosphate 3-epimerase